MKVVVYPEVRVQGQPSRPAAADPQNRRCRNARLVDRAPHHLGEIEEALRDVKWFGLRILALRYWTR
jgi:hypothetical protein